MAIWTFFLLACQIVMVVLKVSLVVTFSWWLVFVPAYVLIVSWIIAEPGLLGGVFDVLADVLLLTWLFD